MVHFHSQSSLESYCAAVVATVAVVCDGLADDHVVADDNPGVAAATGDGLRVVVVVAGVVVVAVAGVVVVVVVVVAVADVDVADAAGDNDPAVAAAAFELLLESVASGVQIAELTLNPFPPWKTDRAINRTSTHPRDTDLRSYVDTCHCRQKTKLERWTGSPITQTMDCRHRTSGFRRWPAPSAGLEFREFP